MTPRTDAVDNVIRLMDEVQHLKTELAEAMVELADCRAENHVLLEQLNTPLK